MQKASSSELNFLSLLRQLGVMTIRYRRFPLIRGIGWKLTRAGGRSVYLDRRSLNTRDQIGQFLWEVMNALHQMQMTNLQWPSPLNISDGNFTRTHLLLPGEFSEESLLKVREVENLILSVRQELEEHTGNLGPKITEAEVPRYFRYRDVVPLAVGLASGAALDFIFLGAPGSGTLYAGAFGALGSMVVYQSIPGEGYRKQNESANSFDRILKLRLQLRWYFSNVSRLATLGIVLFTAQSAIGLTQHLDDISIPIKNLQQFLSIDSGKADRTRKDTTWLN